MSVKSVGVTVADVAGDWTIEGSLDGLFSASLPYRKPPEARIGKLVPTSARLLNDAETLIGAGG